MAILKRPIGLEEVVNFESLDIDMPLVEGNSPQEIPAIAISIVSNSRLLSEGLFALLLPHLRLRLIGTYSSELHIRSPLPNPPRHIVLLDSSIGHVMAIAWTQRWRGLIPPALVLILELVNDNSLILACIEAGASGFTLQGASASAVAEAIKDVSCGVAHCSPEITAQLYARLASLTATITQLSVSPLTVRESEILQLVASGYTNMDIAAHLVIELRTVKQHIHNMLGKLNSRNRQEAVRFASERGWLAKIPQSH
jgi:DNA-binding NarL/FixJ family response regulator